MAEAQTQEWRARVGGTDGWHSLTVEWDGEGAASRNDWAAIAAEGYVVGLADEYEWDDGDLITVELISPAGQDFKLDMLLRQQWTADVYSAEGMEH